MKKPRKRKSRRRYDEEEEIVELPMITKKTPPERADLTGSGGRMLNQR